MIKKNKFILIFMIILITFILSGCDSNNQNDEIDFDSNVESVEERVTDFYRLIFKDYDQTVIYEESYQFNADLSRLTINNPTREGYAFDGWDQAIPATMPATDTTLYANWTPKTYTVTFDSSGITVSSGPIDVVFASTYGTLPTATRTGYTFNGWYTASNGGSLVTSNTIVSTSTNHTLYAQWDTNRYKLTFKNHDESVLFEESYGYNADLSRLIIDKPTREGYIFGGWNQDIPSTMPETNVVIYASWIKLPTITINGMLVTSNGAIFDVNLEDESNLGGVTQVKLYKDKILIDSLDYFTSKSFTVYFPGLLSDEEYNFEIIYDFELNEGVEQQSKLFGSKLNTKPIEGFENISRGIITEPTSVSYNPDYEIFVNGDLIANDFQINTQDKYEISIYRNEILVLKKQVSYYNVARINLPNYFDDNNFGTTQARTFIGGLLSGDVYIAQGTRMLIMNANVSGSIYNYGKLVIIDSRVSGTIYSNVFNFSTINTQTIFTTPDQNGTMYAQNVTNPSTGFTTNLSNDVPYYLSRNVVEVNGRRVITGAGLPFYSLQYSFSLDGERFDINSSSNGTFAIDVDEDFPPVIYVIYYYNTSQYKYWEIKLS